MFGNLAAISTKSMSNLHLYALPYFRYYFLPNPNLRPYLLVGVGISYNMANAGTIEGMASRKLATYAGTSVSAKIGVGIRLLKFLEVGLSYNYAGKMSYEKNNDLFDSASQEYQQGIQYLKPTLKQVYNLHTLLLHVSITLGGNIKKN
jgi:outer membrane protein W